ncbi:hypothetical protein, partial [Endozoicomonas acroporae]|uniref:hypothetical protein n=1 Tax=Endozoicomonas acroporae TaxID=1701104 RepID=UPI003D7B3DA5
NVTLLAAANEDHYAYLYKTKKSGLFGSTKKKHQIDKTSIEQVGTVVESGGDLNIESGKHLVLQASELKSED